MGHSIHTRASHVAALTNVDKVCRLVDGKGLEAREEGLGVGLVLKEGAGLDLGHLLDDFADVVGRGATAATDNVDEPVGCKADEGAGHAGRALVVLAKRVGETGVGVADDVGGGELGDVLDERTHLGRTEGTVEAEGKRARVRDRRHKRLARLSRERASTHVDDRARDERGHALVLGVGVKQLVDGEKGGLGVEGVKDGLDEEHVRAAVQQADDLLRVGDDELLKGDVAIAGVGDLGWVTGVSTKTNRGTRLPKGRWTGCG